MARGVGLITWTFDPLQARNANLNLRRLGGTATEFLQDFYGVTTVVAAPRPAHRSPARALGAERAPRARAAVRGRPAADGADAQPCRASTTSSGRPAGRCRRSRGSSWTQPELLLEIPPEWDVLCQAAPRVAADWQGKVRRALPGLPRPRLRRAPTSRRPKRAAGAVRCISSARAERSLGRPLGLVLLALACCGTAHALPLEPEPPPSPEPSPSPVAPPAHPGDASTRFTREDLRTFPRPSDPWSLLREIPGVVLDRVNVGGSETGLQSLVVTGGDGGAGTVWTMDGVDVTDPSALGSLALFPDMDARRERAGPDARGGRARPDARSARGPRAAIGARAVHGGGARARRR